MPFSSGGISAEGISALGTPTAGGQACDQCCVRRKPCNDCFGSMGARWPSNWLIAPAVTQFQDTNPPPPRICDQFNGEYNLQQEIPLPSPTGDPGGTVLNPCYWSWGRQTVAPPYGLSASLAAGGSLTVGQTYFYKVTALGPWFNAFHTGNTDNLTPGETTPSNEVSITPTPGNQSVVLTWNDPPADFVGRSVINSTGNAFNIYRGTTAGGENRLVGSSLNNGNPETFTDTGAAGTVGTPPTANTTGAAVFDRVELYQSGSGPWTIRFTDLIGPPQGTGASCQAFYYLGGPSGSPDLLNPDTSNTFTFDHLTNCSGCSAWPTSLTIYPSNYCGCCFNAAIQGTVYATITEADDPACACLVGQAWAMTYAGSTATTDPLCWTSPRRLVCSQSGVPGVRLALNCSSQTLYDSEGFLLTSGGTSPFFDNYAAPMTRWSVAAPSGSGRKARVDLIFSGGQLVSALVSYSGFAYTPGNVTITITPTPGFGSGAAAHAVANAAGLVTAVVIDNPGSGYPDMSCNPLTLPFRLQQNDLANGQWCGSSGSNITVVVTS